MACILITGAPGSGKGTQAAALAGRIGALHISTGDVFRDHVSRGTDLGRAARTHMDAGRYVPDDITNAMVRDRLRDAAASGSFILDGYPRTVDQAKYLDTVLAEIGVELVAVIALLVDTEELVGRLVLRGRTEGRSDDTEEVVRRRQDVYLAETAPLLDVYRGRGLLREVDGTGEIEAVADRIDRALGSRH